MYLRWEDDQTRALNRQLLVRPVPGPTVAACRASITFPPAG